MKLLTSKVFATEMCQGQGKVRQVTIYHKKYTTVV